MNSIASYHYPLISWYGGRRYLWNPIHKKRLKNRPEERVRLRILEALLTGGWSRHRISTEEAIPSPAEDTSLRTDLVCYNGQFEPRILIECKSEQVRLSEQTALQSARYNRNVGASYILLTNGVTDRWFRIAREYPEPVGELPDLFEEDPRFPHTDFNYWCERGFAGSNPDPRLRHWLLELLPAFLSQYHEEMAGVKFLDFKQSPGDLDLAHYYRILEHGDRKYAVSFLSTAYGGSRMAIVLNEEGRNVAVAEINLDLIVSGEALNTTLYSSNGSRNIDAVSVFGLEFDEDVQELLKNLPARLSALFTDER